MTIRDLSLLDGIQLAKEAEQKAGAFYADAATKTKNPLGKKLFEQLAEFEGNHFRALVAMETFLRDKGTFAGYEGKEQPFPKPSEVSGIEEPNKMSALEIITQAIEIEREAEKKYFTLADQTNDPTVHSLFLKLAEEEHNHYRILRDAYWNLNNRGVWEWR